MSVLSSAVGSGTTAIAFALVGFSKFCAHGAGNTMSRDSLKKWDIQEILGCINLLKE